MEKYKNVLIKRTNSKSLVLKEEYGKVILSASKYATPTEIKTFIDMNQTWIKEHTKPDYKPTLWGEEYNGEYELNSLYRYEIQKETEKILKECINLVGVKPTQIKYRKMKNWGNCKKNGIITLNTKLASKKKEALRMTLIHELCHLKEFNHTKRFWNLMDKYCPEHKRIKKELER